MEQVSMKWLPILVLLLSCSGGLPSPCDPTVTATRQAAIATECRIEANKTCPGYDSMTEDKKMECPGVLQCLDRIEAVESSCHGS
jgi:hypothetical protein